MRHAARVDSTQAEIVAALRTAGASVWVLGLPVDLAIGFGGKTVLAEVKRKTGKRVVRTTPYTQLQKDFMLNWKGGPVATLTDVDGALTLLEVLRGRT